MLLGSSPAWPAKLKGEYMTGAYVRIKRNDKWENIEVEHLNDEERKDLFTDHEELMKWFNFTCNKLVEIEQLLTE